MNAVDALVILALVVGIAAGAVLSWIILHAPEIASNRRARRMQARRSAQR